MGFNLDKLAEMAQPRSEEAQNMARIRKENKEWLRMSQEIALSLHYYLRKMKMTQKELAEKMGVSPAYVGKLLKGQENLTLETICNLQKVTGRELVSVCHPYECIEVLEPISVVVSKSNVLVSKTYYCKQNQKTGFSPISGDVA
ncbi:MAG: helix-turn-helix domain-containing protein [Parabacteroides sp.]|nr:helix-turn-helix domain-containing protein [Parabacteroides sp.]